MGPALEHTRALNCRQRSETSSATFSIGESRRRDASAVVLPVVRPPQIKQYDDYNV
jgi:hypothetical protein